MSKAVHDRAFGRLWEIRNARGTPIATIRFRDEFPLPDWLSIKGRSFFWQADPGAFVELADDERPERL